MDSHTIGKDEEGKWYWYTLHPLSEVEAIALGLRDRVGKEKAD